MAHAWLKDVDQDALLRKEVVPDYIPDITVVKDPFEAAQDHEEVKLSEINAARLDIVNDY